jgi:polyketide biosynthesis acyl carrier protein
MEQLQQAAVEMDHQQILDVVIKHLRRNVDGLDNVAIDPSNSMAQYSASSLDIVEVVSASMRELGIRIPRTKLSQVKNMNELVDAFYNAKNQAN